MLSSIWPYLAQYMRTRASLYSRPLSELLLSHLANVKGYLIDYRLLAHTA
ncbi:MAG TPA: hypothetical protein VK692_04935 [Chthoniobacterales bacterium]|nr:hypothetical protein [Chthoniobacterales bacterium]